MKALSTFKQLTCLVFILGLTVSLMNSCSTKTSNILTDTEIAQQAFTYGLPLVLMDITRLQQTKHTVASQYGAPMNQLSNKQGFPTYKDTGVVAPNVDTYYSIAWGDVTNEPIVLYVPNTKGRYYMMPLLDAFTNVFKSPGTRTGDTLGGTFLVTKRDWDGTLPAGIEKKNHFRCPTGFFWMIGRIQCNDSTDGVNNVIPIQDSMKFMPLSNWLNNTKQPPVGLESNVPQGSPNDIVKDSMSIDSFFRYLNRLLIDNPPAIEDAPAMKLFAKIGVGPGLNFNMDTFDVSTQDSLRQIPTQMFAQYNKLSSAPTNLLNGWNFKTSGMGYYGIRYLERAIVAVKGLGANLAKDAVYPSSYVDASGSAYDGSKNTYKIQFLKDSFPPVGAFWSLTLYNQKGNLDSNAIGRYAVGHNTSAPLDTASDGSISIYIQNSQPSNVSLNNWLPAPADTFNLMMRLYWPNTNNPTILDSTWIPPKVICTNCPTLK